LAINLYSYRKHGKAPYKIAFLHGGPGGAGDMYSVAKHLASDFGILEPLQCGLSIQQQIDELHSCFKEQSNEALIVVGFSWGAWLATIFAAKYPDLVKKLIFIGAGAFTEDYIQDMTKVRMQRLKPDEQQEVNSILLKMNGCRTVDKKLFQKFGCLMSKADAYDFSFTGDSRLDFRPDIFQSVWPEAAELRRSGELLNLIKKINCPLTAIHGLQDPHPWQGVEEPIRELLPEFNMIKIDKCGHSPWKEKYVKEEFYKIMNTELND